MRASPVLRAAYLAPLLLATAGTAARAQSPAIAAPPPAPPPPQAAPAPAPPAPPPPLAESLTGGAKADYDAAVLLLKNNDFAGAEIKFQSAYDQAKDARLFFNLAACEKNQRHYAKTIAFLERYRAEGGERLTQADRDEADRLLLALRPYASNLSVTSDPPGAKVYVDDEPVGTTPLANPLRVDIGHRRVRLTKDGFADVVNEINVTGRGDMSVSATLRPVTHEGRLVVHAAPEDTIALDGSVVATGQYDAPVPSGGHQLRVTAEGKVPFLSEVLVKDDEPRTIDVTLESAKAGVPAWVWIAGGVLVAGGLGTGAYFALKPGTTTQAPPPGTMGIATLSVR